MTIRPRRSVLYMPGSNLRALEKAKTLPADGLILDLEDAVAPDAKETARAQVSQAVKAGGFGKREILFASTARHAWFSDIPGRRMRRRRSWCPRLQRCSNRSDGSGYRHARTSVFASAMIETPLAIFTAVTQRSEDRPGGGGWAPTTSPRKRGRASCRAAPMLAWPATQSLLPRTYGIDIRTAHNNSRTPRVCT